MRALFAVFVFSCFALPAHGQAIRCTGADGVVRYQQTPCPGGKPVNMSGVGEADFTSQGALQARREVAQQQRASDVQANINTGRVGVGMTSLEAFQAWGSPSRVNSTVTARGSSQQWVYRRERGAADYVYVTDGVVTAVQSSR